MKAKEYKRTQVLQIGQFTLRCDMCKKELHYTEFRQADIKNNRIYYANCKNCYKKWMREAREEYNERNLVYQEKEGKIPFIVTNRKAF